MVYNKKQHRAHRDPNHGSSKKRKRIQRQKLLTRYKRISERYRRRLRKLLRIRNK